MLFILKAYLLIQKTLIVCFATIRHIFAASPPLAWSGVCQDLYPTAKDARRKWSLEQRACFRDRSLRHEFIELSQYPTAEFGGRDCHLT